MTPEDLIAELRRRGATLRPAANGLHVAAPKGAISPLEWQTLKAHKGEILALLGSYNCALCGRYAFSTPGITCFWCRDALETNARPPDY